MGSGEGKFMIFVASFEDGDGDWEGREAHPICSRSNIRCFRISAWNNKRLSPLLFPPSSISLEELVRGLEKIMFTHGLFPQIGANH